jgi:hypothetical protein
VVPEPARPLQDEAAEHDYAALRHSYDTLRADHDALRRDKDVLIDEVRNTLLIPWFQFQGEVLFLTCVHTKKKKEDSLRRLFCL